VDFGRGKTLAFSRRRRVLGRPMHSQS
jgi:hypothetical protein